MKKNYIPCLFITLYCLFISVSEAEQLPIATFSEAGSSELSLEGWVSKSFSGMTSYQLFQLKDQKALKADSDNAASALVKKIKIDLVKYPYLNWSWKIENRLNINDEKIKSGDDYVVRVYVVVDGGLLPWRTKALSYVWTNGVSKGDVWPNAFAGKNAMMMALRSKKDKTSVWYSEKRNVYKDLKQLFGTEFKSIDAVVLMTDTDNSHQKVTSYYGDIFFSEK